MLSTWTQPPLADLATVETAGVDAEAEAAQGAADLGLGRMVAEDWEVVDSETEAADWEMADLEAEARTEAAPSSRIWRAAVTSCEGSGDGG